jgi:phosphatidylglycerol:prolipoprotein diacylglycerol transferase
MIPLAAVALVFIRLGCFLNGCCFGRVSNVPWAVAFPKGSWAYYYHRVHGWIPSTAEASLPVHPLQLYFLLAAVTSGAIVLKLQRRNAFPGSVQLVFYTLFFASTACLEPLRENFLTLNNWLAPLLTVIAGGLLLGLTLARGQATPLTAEVTRNVRL